MRKLVQIAALVAMAFYVREYTETVGGILMKVCVYNLNGSEITRLQKLVSMCPLSIEVQQF
jgi:hypothetical protein